MQLTVSTDDPLEHVLAVVGALYGVRLTVEEEPAREPLSLGDEGDRITKTRH